MSTKKITIGLDDKRTQAFEEARGLAPLPEVVKEAVKILNPGWNPDKGESIGCPLNSRWLTIMALRAVAEAIIRDGRMPCPPRVEFDYSDFEGKPSILPFGRSKSDEDDAEDLDEQIDKYPQSFDNWPEFKNVAASIGVETDRLAYLLCFAAARYPLLARFVLRFNK